MYIPLCNKSNYSLLSSLLKIDDLINYAKEKNISSIALTDTNMYGIMEFISKCKKENIKPIVGLNILIDDYNFFLLAKDYIGYKSLIKLSTIQNERKVLFDDILQFNKNVICILPFLYKEEFSNLGSIYSDIYLGYGTKKEELEALLITQKIVFIRESLYLDRDDSKILPFLYMIRDGKTVTDDVNYQVDGYELDILNVNELSSEKGLKTTIEIASLCNLEFPEALNLLPIYECDDPQKYLFELCKKGLFKRLSGNISNSYKERLLYELEMINKMGFSNYFLVVYDFIKYAKKNNILVGPGRGSAAGSLVAYSLGITEIDPLKYDLLFERFLNPERKTMPDIDTDFPDNKRDEVINYVVEKYGKRRVCGIVTFGTLSAKQVIRDVSRVLNISLAKVDSLCKFIPTVTKEKLKDFYHNNALFKSQIDSDISLTKMFEIASYIEGFPRHTSSHAAGIVMSRVDLDEVIPLTTGDNMYLTSYSMEYLEDLGLLKMDFLGLKNLTIIDNIINDIKKQYNVELDFAKIPLDDLETLKLFEKADTSGIFQFESNGMKNFLRKLKPNSFNDVVAAIALFRPGAAPNIEPYIRRKFGQEDVSYIDESLKDISKDTYGLLIYQEQVMQAANLYAGYTLGEADILRRAMSKKKLDLLKNEEEKFISKSIAKGHSEEQAKKVFGLVLNFAGYGFNKSHSVAYSIIALKMAYLKCHYKTVFFANLLTNVIGSETKTHEYIMEAKANNIEVVKPTINESRARYIVKDGKIIFPLSNIKSIGLVVSSTINKAQEDGPFQDIFDCFSRLYIAGIGKKTLEILINADVFREFGFNRATLIYNLDSLFNYAELTRDIDPSLVMKPDIVVQSEYSNTYLLNKEKEVFGFYLSSHPATFYKAKNKNCISLNMISSCFNKVIDVIILVDKIKVITTKKGDKMAFVTGSDETAVAEFTIFPRLFKEFSDIEKGNILKIKGVVEKRLNEYKIIANEIERMEGEVGEENI